MRLQNLCDELQRRAGHWFGLDNELRSYEACAVDKWMTCISKCINNVGDFSPDIARIRPVGGRGDRRYEQ
jgi:hypothetical protein